MKTDLELQILLAKMLPEKIIAPTPKAITFFWQRTDIDDVDVDVRRIKDTEWLHACWLIEQGLTDEEHNHYRSYLAKETTVERYPKDITTAVSYSAKNERAYISASWQQRATALIAVKEEK